MSCTDPNAYKLCCREVNEFLVAYGEGLLGPDLRAQFEAHLARCSCCMKYMDQYRTTIALAREAESATATPLPDELVRMTMSFLRERLSPGARR